MNTERHIKAIPIVKSMGAVCMLTKLLLPANQRIPSIGQSSAKA